MHWHTLLAPTAYSPCPNRLGASSSCTLIRICSASCSPSLLNKILPPPLSAPEGAICWLCSFNLLLSCAALRAAFTSAKTWLKVLQNSQLLGTEHETPTTEKLHCLEKLSEWCTVHRTCPGVNVFCIRVCLFSHPTGTPAIMLYYSTRLEQLRIGS